MKIWTDAEVHAHLTAPRPLASTPEEVAHWPRCPACRAPIEETDHRFCQWCGQDLRPLMHRCGSCEWGEHVASGHTPAGACPMCGEVMPAYSSPASSFSA